MAEAAKTSLTWLLRTLSTLLFAAITYIGDDIKGAILDLKVSSKESAAQVLSIRAEISTLTQQGAILAQREVANDQTSVDTKARVSSLEDWRRVYYEVDNHGKNHDK